MAKKKRDEYIREHDQDGTDIVSFHLVDAKTVERRMKEGDITLPKKKVDVPKDKRWNTKQLNSKLLAGILNGDSIPNIANSLMDVIGNNQAAATRNARTMVTGAENAGRKDSYKALEEQGVIQKKVWIATADDRTRESHLMLDGEEVDIDDPFSNGLMYPGDPSGEPEEVYNCRCSMRTHIVGIVRQDTGEYIDIKTPHENAFHKQQIEAEEQRREDAKPVPDEKAEETMAGKVERDYDCDFAKNYGKEYYDAMCDLMDNCDNEALKNVWQQYQSQIVAADPNFKGRAVHRSGRIYVNKEKDIKGNSYEAPYAVTYHESGHAIDYITRDMADGNGFAMMYSSAYQNGAFPASIRSEVADLVKAKDAELKAAFKEHKDDYKWLHENGLISDYAFSFYERNGYLVGGEPKYSKSLAYSAIEKEVRSVAGGMLAYGDLSDMLEGATGGKISCGIGHGKSYWGKVLGVDKALATEAFAEMTSATATNKESLELIKQYLPKSYAIYNDMLNEIAKAKGGT